MARALIICRDSVPNSNPAGLIAYRYARLISNFSKVDLISITKKNGKTYDANLSASSINLHVIRLTGKVYIDLFKYLYTLFLALAILLRNRNCSLITHTNPLYTHFYGIIIKFISLGNVNWIASFTDPYANSPFEEKNINTVGHYIRHIEQSLVFALSNKLVFVTEKMKKYIINNDKKLEAKSTVIPFFYLHDDVVNAMNKLICHDKIRLIHPGSIYGNRDASHLFKAMEGHDNIHLKIFGNVNNHDVDNLSSNIEVFSEVDYKFLKSEVERSDYILVIDSFFKDIPNPYMPSKVVDAMCLGKPIIGVTEESSELKLFLDSTGNVSSLNDVESISSVLRSLSNPGCKVDYSNYSESAIYESKYEELRGFFNG